ncbi:GTP pyrophosphokinase family protein [Megasphaera elsdenii]|uniref:GTP pyrophosphokinase n=1 Tax=Megasphaera elsdenii TaxID=907 RepID=UPI001D03153B|nr:GTP pyrophosphokinase family protein [Megasphaera elsdenii]MCB5702002.1 GTP pyrophosphokinase family protein [Megasphaera elsdenii]MCB5726864.1 GTP pyrophosphokinase family protein [Megasphaera elsdenii]MCB5770643.1 GTP pyrophosphokinase family protein [Megasphaera elsdenii]
MDSIYGSYRLALEATLNNLIDRIRAYSDDMKKKTGEAAYEHLIYRIKSESSMREKCDRKGLPQTAYSALHDIRDAIGIRIVCCFLDDIYKAIDFIKSLDGVRLVEEKDYIRHVKPNGYRSYHVILELEEPYEDVTGANPGHFYAEVQLRTIAMDSWASLEHQMKYKHDIKNPELIVRELKRCADELASCDVSMQTIRNLIHAQE